MRVQSAAELRNLGLALSLVVQIELVLDLRYLLTPRRHEALVFEQVSCGILKLRVGPLLLGWLPGLANEVWELVGLQFRVPELACADWLPVGVVTGGIVAVLGSSGGQVHSVDYCACHWSQVDDVHPRVAIVA